MATMKVYEIKVSTFTATENKLNVSNGFYTSKRKAMAELKFKVELWKGRDVEWKTLDADGDGDMVMLSFYDCDGNYRIYSTESHLVF